MDILDRIDVLCKKRGITRRQMEKEAGLSTGSTSKWRSGFSPNQASLSKLSSYFGVTVDYLLGRDENSLESILGKPSPGAVRIPVLGRVAAGIPLYTLEEIIDWEEIPETMAKSGEYIALSIKGHSMEPRICDGDVVIVRRQSTCNSGSVAIVLVNGNEAACKRVKFSEHGISLISSNPEYEPLFYTKKEIDELPVEIFGVVVELRGKFNN